MTSVRLSDILLYADFNTILSSKDKQCCCLVHWLLEVIDGEHHQIAGHLHIIFDEMSVLIIC